MLGETKTPSRSRRRSDKVGTASEERDNSNSERRPRPPDTSIECLGQGLGINPEYKLGEKFATLSSIFSLTFDCNFVEKLCSFEKQKDADKIKRTETSLAGNFLYIF